MCLTGWRKSKSWDGMCTNPKTNNSLNSRLRYRDYIYIHLRMPSLPCYEIHAPLAVYECAALTRLCLLCRHLLY
jgi:hypothetical protein